MEGDYCSLNSSINNHYSYLWDFPFRISVRENQLLYLHNYFLKWFSKNQQNALLLLLPPSCCSRSRFYDENVCVGVKDQALTQQRTWHGTVLVNVNSFLPSLPLMPSALTPASKQGDRQKELRWTDGLWTASCSFS